MAFAASTIISGIGLAVGAFGAYENYSNSQKAAKANAAAAQNQAAIAQLQAGNVDVQKQQLALTTEQQQLQIATNKSVIQQQQAADDIRQQAASLDATRRIRQAIRAGIVASGTSLNVAASSGATQPGSTAVRQARANIQGETGTNVAGISQNLDLGNQIYGINKSISQTYLQAQDQNAGFVKQSQVLQNKVLDTQKQIYQLGGNASSDYANAALYSGNAAAGQGLYTVGMGVASNYDTINKLTNYFSGIGGSSGGQKYFQPTDI